MRRHVRTLNRPLDRAITSSLDCLPPWFFYAVLLTVFSLLLSHQPKIGTTNYISNNLNQLTATTGALVSSYTYDFNGNRQTYTKNAQTDTYGYDFENRLVQLQKNVTGTGIQTGTFTYNYDYRMRRVLRNETAAGGIATKLVFSGGTSVQEYNVNFPATPVVEYARGSDYGGGIGGILYTLRSGTASFNHYNSRGDVVAKTAANGALTYQAAYEAYGKRTQEQGSTQDRQKANTKDEDPTGLLNEGFRYRDLETGTFITRDPLGFVDGPNMYGYVVQNPWTKFDPRGLQGSEKRKQDDVKKAAISTKEIKDMAVDAVGAVVGGIKDNVNAVKVGGEAAKNGQTAEIKVLGGALAVAGVLSLSGELTGPGKVTALKKAGAAAVDAGLQKSSKEIVKESVNAAEKQVAAKSGPLAAGGAKLENLSPRQLARIQAVAEKRGLDISVVGSRAEGTADGASDWDYILKGGNSKARHSAMRELPSNPNASKGGDFRLGSEDLRGVDVDPELPHINFTPTKK